ncbi:MAG: PEP-utilizing enzyme [Candidatus Woesearchaeota archaeon]
MTSPDFIVGMKKASAIITDEGGLTSHAAIMSRELGKPCIIGTKTATKVLKDGDVVEINSESGVIRIIN